MKKRRVTVIVTFAIIGGIAGLFNPMGSILAALIGAVVGEVVWSIATD